MQQGFTRIMLDGEILRLDEIAGPEKEKIQRTVCPGRPRCHRTQMMMNSRPDCRFGADGLF